MIEQERTGCIGSVRRAVCPQRAGGVYRPKVAAHQGFSLVEILVVVAIIAVMITVMIKVGSVVRTNARIKESKNTILILVQALQEYRRVEDDQTGDFVFPDDPDTVSGPLPDDADFSDMMDVLSDYLTVDDDDAGDHVGNFFFWDDGDVIDGDQKDERRYALATIELMYAVLEDVPASRAVLERLPRSAKANDDNDSATVGGRPKQLVEVNDAWRHPIRYRNNGKGNFPTLTSAGPDGEFDTADDIISDEF